MGGKGMKLRVTWIILGLLATILITNFVAVYNILKIFLLNQGRNKARLAAARIGSKHSTNDFKALTTIYEPMESQSISQQPISTSSTLKHRRRYKFDAEKGKYIRIRGPQQIAKFEPINDDHRSSSSSSSSSSPSPSSPSSSSSSSPSSSTLSVVIVENTPLIAEKPELNIPESDSAKHHWRTIEKNIDIRPSSSSLLSPSPSNIQMGNAVETEINQVELDYSNIDTEFGDHQSMEFDDDESDDDQLDGMSTVGDILEATGDDDTKMETTKVDHHLTDDDRLQSLEIQNPSRTTATSVFTTTDRISMSINDWLPTTNYYNQEIDMTRERLSDDDQFDSSTISENSKLNNKIDTIVDDGTTRPTDSGQSMFAIELNVSDEFVSDKDTSPWRSEVDDPSRLQTSKKAEATTTTDETSIKFESTSTQTTTGITKLVSNQQISSTVAPILLTGFTLVTALLDIGRGEWWEYRRPLESYYEYLDNVLRLKIVPITLAELPLYRYMPMVTEIIKSEQYGGRWSPKWDRVMTTHPEAKSPEYDILVNSKPYFLYNASIINPFSSEYFIWLDAGYAHGNQSVFPRNFDWHPVVSPQKITLIKITPDYDSIFRYKIEDLYRKNWAVVSGGFLAGDLYAINHFYWLYFRVLVDMIYRQLIDDDQTTLVLLIQQQPSLFQIVIGDWFDAFRLFGGHF